MLYTTASDPALYFGCSCYRSSIHVHKYSAHIELSFHISIWLLHLARSRSPTMLSILLVCPASSPRFRSRNVCVTDGCASEQKWQIYQWMVYVFTCPCMSHSSFLILLFELPMHDSYTYNHNISSAGTQCCSICTYSWALSLSLHSIENCAFLGISKQR